MVHRTVRIIRGMIGEPFPSPNFDRSSINWDYIVYYCTFTGQSVRLKIAVNCNPSIKSDIFK